MVQVQYTVYWTQTEKFRKSQNLTFSKNYFFERFKPFWALLTYTIFWVNYFQKSLDFWKSQNLTISKTSLNGPQIAQMVLKPPGLNWVRVFELKGALQCYCLLTVTAGTWWPKGTSIIFKAMLVRSLTHFIDFHGTNYSNLNSLKMNAGHWNPGHVLKRIWNHFWD